MSTFDAFIAMKQEAERQRMFEQAAQRNYEQAIRQQQWQRGFSNTFIQEPAVSAVAAEAHQGLVIETTARRIPAMEVAQ